ncbi:MAG: AAA family ATPase [Candidatus Pacebacteria bacterium]|nr:AAA family ATPase [Candidatus Paceibacterota bacterium]
MKYLSFTIHKYRAIDTDLAVVLEKNRLVPIIGVNECGKTTILHAIFAFDYSNDSFDQNVRHLQDVQNLYKPTQKSHASVSATVKITWEEFSKILNNADISKTQGVGSYKRKKAAFPADLTLTRNLITKTYSIRESIFDNKTLNNLIAQKIIARLPYILYFDDFRDSFPEEIEIKKDSDDTLSGWLPVVERLFKKTNKDFTVFDLESMDTRARKSVLSEVQKFLNATLIKEWENFKLDNKKALKINIEYFPSFVEQTIQKPPRIKFEILETDSTGVDHFFYIRDRSKGFFWFFNFVMKLEFNPKVISNDGVDAVYLLDEPGSYLHASAQSRLCSKLNELSIDNYVIYCTHSHYLLDPEIIPLSSIRISEKVEPTFGIKLSSIYEYDSVTGKKNAFQPIYDALQLKPFAFDVSNRVVLVEGIYDYYCLNMFLGKTDIHFLPSLNADSVLYYTSLMIGWGIDFNTLWDNDSEGRVAQEKALIKFGNELGKKMHLLPLKGKQKKCIMQDLVDGVDMLMIKNELDILGNSSFEKTIASLFYSNGRAKILEKVSTKTFENFETVQSLFKFNK